jgi:flagellar protein FliJ
MKAFVFSLQKVLDVKRARESAAEQALAGALQQAEATKRRLQGVQAELRERIRRVEQLRGTATPADRLRSELRYLDALHEEIDGLAQRLSAQEQEVERRRAALKAALRERKTLERACVRERDDWLLAARREEQKQTDEIAGVAFWRRRLGGPVGAASEPGHGRDA